MKKINENAFKDALEKAKPMEGLFNKWQFENLKDLISKDSTKKEYKNKINIICKKISYTLIILLLCFLFSSCQRINYMTTKKNIVIYKVTSPSKNIFISYSYYEYGSIHYKEIIKPHSNRYEFYFLGNPGKTVYLRGISNIGDSILVEIYYNQELVAKRTHGLYIKKPVLLYGKYYQNLGASILTSLPK